MSLKKLSMNVVNIVDTDVEENTMIHIKILDNKTSSVTCEASH